MKNIKYNIINFEHIFILLYLNLNGQITTIWYSMQKNKVNKWKNMWYSRTLFWFYSNRYSKKNRIEEIIFIIANIRYKNIGKIIYNV